MYVSNFPSTTSWKILIPLYSSDAFLINQLILYVYVSVLSILFHCSIFLLLYQHHPILIFLVFSEDNVWSGKSFHFLLLFFFLHNCTSYSWTFSHEINNQLVSFHEFFITFMPFLRHYMLTISLNYFEFTVRWVLLSVCRFTPLQ